VTFEQLILTGLQAQDCKMSNWMNRRLRVWVSALALIGALQHAWVLAIHTTAPLGIELAAAASGMGDAGYICHSGQNTAQDDGSGVPSPSDDGDGKTSCPICLGLASLYVAVIASPVTIIRGSEREIRLAAPAADAIPQEHRPSLRNRGPPLLG
jgi:DUF2946 family protein